MKKEKRPLKLDVITAQTASTMLSLFMVFMCYALLQFMWFNLLITIQFTKAGIVRTYRKMNGMPYNYSETFQSLKFIKSAAMAFYVEHDRLPRDIAELKSAYNIKFPEAFMEQYYAIDPENYLVYCISDKNEYKYELRENLAIIDMLKITTYITNYFIKGFNLPDGIAPMKNIMVARHYSFFNNTYNVDKAGRKLTSKIPNSRVRETYLNFMFNEIKQ